MNKEELTQIYETFEKEIQEYKELRDLYLQKKECIIAQDVDKLNDTDTQIIQKVSKIKEINAKRQAPENEQRTLSSLIEIAKDVDTELYELLIAKKEEVEQLAQELAKLEKTNFELLKQGMNLTLKMFNKMMGSNYAPTDEYNNKGKTKITTDVSSIETSI